MIIVWSKEQKLSELYCLAHWYALSYELLLQCFHLIISRFHTFLHVVFLTKASLFVLWLVLFCVLLMHIFLSITCKFRLVASSSAVDCPVCQ